MTEIAMTIMIILLVFIVLGIFKIRRLQKWLKSSKP